MRLARNTWEPSFLNCAILFPFASLFLFGLFPIHYFIANETLLFQVLIILSFILVSALITYTISIICTSNLGILFFIILFLLFSYSYGISIFRLPLPVLIFMISPLNIFKNLRVNRDFDNSINASQDYFQTYPYWLFDSFDYAKYRSLGIFK